MLRRLSAIILIVCFLTTGVVPPSLAQGLALPLPGGMLALSAPVSPVLLRGMRVDPRDPLGFDFIFDGGVETLHATSLHTDASRLIKYFLAALTIPEKDLWVNLSPYEKDRIIPEAFGQTEMGRDLLAQDYILKQVTASLLYPEGEVGKEFWAKIYAQAQEQFGTTDIPVDTFNKVWIVPAKAVVYENDPAHVGAGSHARPQEATAFIVESRLKVMLESDYLAMEHNGERADIKSAPTTQGNGTSSVGEDLVSSRQDMSRDILREVVIPILEKEINEGANFALLRQVYHSLILATWYKKKVRESLLSAVYVDRNKVDGVNIADPQEALKIWHRYVEAFSRGAYDLIREEKDAVSGEMVPRKYFSGGMDMKVEFDTVDKIDRAQVPSDTWLVHGAFKDAAQGEDRRDQDALEGMGKSQRMRKILMQLDWHVFKGRNGDVYRFKVSDPHKVSPDFYKVTAIDRKDTVIGTFFFSVKTDHTIALDQLMVDMDHQNQGVAAQLLKKLRSALLPGETMEIQNIINEPTLTMLQMKAQKELGKWRDFSKNAARKMIYEYFQKGDVEKGRLDEWSRKTLFGRVMLRAGFGRTSVRPVFETYQENSKVFISMIGYPENDTPQARDPSLENLLAEDEDGARGAMLPVRIRMSRKEDLDAGIPKDFAESSLKEERVQDILDQVRSHHFTGRNGEEYRFKVLPASPMLPGYFRIVAISQKGKKIGFFRLSPETSHTIAFDQWYVDRKKRHQYQGVASALLKQVREALLQGETVELQNVINDPTLLLLQMRAQKELGKQDEYSHRAAQKMVYKYYKKGEAEKQKLEQWLKETPIGKIVMNAGFGQMELLPLEYMSKGHSEVSLSIITGHEQDMDGIQKTGGDLFDKADEERIKLLLEQVSRGSFYELDQLSRSFESKDILMALEVVSRAVFMSLKMDGFAMQIWDVLYRASQAPRIGDGIFLKIVSVCNQILYKDGFSYQDFFIDSVLRSWVGNGSWSLLQALVPAVMHVFKTGDSEARRSAFEILLQMSMQAARADVALMARQVIKEGRTLMDPFIAQPDSHRQLGEDYRAAPEIVEAAKDGPMDPVTLQNFLAVEAARLQSAGSGMTQEDMLDAARSDLLSGKGRVNVVAVRDVLREVSLWVRDLLQGYRGYHRVYLARDAGFMHLADQMFMAKAERTEYAASGASVYYLGKARLQGAGIGMSVASMMIWIIDRSLGEMTRDSLNLGLFLKELKRQFRQVYDIDPVFRHYVDATYQELVALGYDKKERLVFVDTGFRGTVPLFLKNVLELHRDLDPQWDPPGSKEHDPRRSGIAIAQIDSMSIEMFQKEFFSLKDVRGRFSIGSALEDKVSAHPMAFDDDTSMFGPSSAVEQLAFYLEKIAAVEAVNEVIVDKGLPDDAQASLDTAGRSKDLGGIDLTSERMNLETAGSGSGIRFNLDSATRAKFERSRGIVPVILGIERMADLPAFLGLK